MTAFTISKGKRNLVRQMLNKYPVPAAKGDNKVIYL